MLSRGNILLMLIARAWSEILRDRYNWLFTVLQGANRQAFHSLGKLRFNTNISSYTTVSYQVQCHIREIGICHLEDEITIFRENNWKIRAAWKRGRECQGGRASVTDLWLRSLCCSRMGRPPERRSLAASLARSLGAVRCGAVVRSRWSIVTV